MMSATVASGTLIIRIVEYLRLRARRGTPVASERLQATRNGTFPGGVSRGGVIRDDAFPGGAGRDEVARDGGSPDEAARDEDRRDGVARIEGVGVRGRGITWGAAPGIVADGQVDQDYRAAGDVGQAAEAGGNGGSAEAGRYGGAARYGGDSGSAEAGSHGEVGSAADGSYGRPGETGRHGATG